MEEEQPIDVVLDDDSSAPIAETPEEKGWRESAVRLPDEDYIFLVQFARKMLEKYSFQELQSWEQIKQLQDEVSTVIQDKLDIIADVTLTPKAYNCTICHHGSNGPSR